MGNAAGWLAVAMVLAAVPQEPPTVTAAWLAMVKAAGVTPAPDVEDGAFFRRVTLDLWGRIPTLEETRAFLDDATPEKRERLVAAMVESPQFAAHQAQVLADLLVGTSLTGPVARARQPAVAWLEDAIGHGQGWDVVVQRLLRVSGTPVMPGEAAFLVAHGRKDAGAQGVAAAVAGKLLGVQMQCAQCHDHPYDTRWKQEDFHALAAFAAPLKVRILREEDPPSVMVRDRGRARVVMTTPKGEERVVEPRFLGRLMLAQSGESSRDVLARAVTHSDLFAKAAVNRAWMQLFGRGLQHPWNDLGAENDPAHPALLTLLAQQFREHGHDLRWLFKTLVLSAPYQRASAGGTPGPATEAVFARAVVRPLTPRQLLNALLVATGVEELARQRRGDAVADRELLRLRRQYQYVFGDDEAGDVETFGGNVPQALMLFNGALVRRGVRVHPAAPLMRIIQRGKEDPGDVINDIYWLCYARPPTDAERTTVRGMLRGQSLRDGSEDLLHAMVASTEFTTNH